MTTALQKSYYSRMLPYARLVQQALGIPAELEVAFWSWETDYGTNSTSKVNNQGGITKGSAGRDFVSGGYAGYNSMDNFVKDRIRLLSLNMAGYPAIVSAARSNAGYEAITRAHNASGWSADDYNVSTIVARAKEVAALGGISIPIMPGKRNPSPKVCPTCHRAY
jgi:flagellum-specific peptidoglycan hydrolase FlgJ